MDLQVPRGFAVRPTLCIYSLFWKSPDGPEFVELVCCFLLAYTDRLSYCLVSHGGNGKCQTEGVMEESPGENAAMKRSESGASNFVSETSFSG
jgi:hypothetical protein